MSFIEIAAIVFVVSLISFTLAYNIIRMLKRKSGCGCCSGCAYKDNCKSATEKTEIK